LSAAQVLHFDWSESFLFGNKNQEQHKFLFNTIIAGSKTDGIFIRNKN